MHKHKLPSLFNWYNLLTGTPKDIGGGNSSFVIRVVAAAVMMLLVAVLLFLIRVVITMFLAAIYFLISSTIAWLWLLIALMFTSTVARVHTITRTTTIPACTITFFTCTISIWFRFWFLLFITTVPIGRLILSFGLSVSGFILRPAISRPI